MPKITVPTADFEALSGYSGLSHQEILELVKLAKGELDVPHCTDDELRIELQDTNRPDTWCVEGITRLLRSHRDGEGGDYSFFQSEAEPVGVIEVDPSVEGVRRYVSGFVAKGYTVDDAGLKAFISSQEVLCRNYGRKRKSVAIGIYDGSSISFPISYTAVDTGDTAHAFVPLKPAIAEGDAAESIPASRWEEAWTPAEILADHPAGREHAAALSVPGKAPLLTDAKGEVLSFPPIINSAKLGRVTEGMNDLFVEVTGTVQDQVLLATNILAANLFDRGATIEAVLTRYPYDTPRGRDVRGPHPLEDRRTVEVKISEFARLLGESPSVDEVQSRLNAFGLGVTASGDSVTVSAPSYRADFLHAVDAIEDYAISRGYDNFEPLLPEDFTVGSAAPETAFADLARDLAIGCGFDEAIGNLLTAIEEVRDKMCVSRDEGTCFHGGPLVRIKNVMNLNYSVLRDWLLPTLHEVASNSSGALFPHRVFEVGEVCRWDATQNLSSTTEWNLAALIADHEVGFSDIQAYLHEILRTLGIGSEGEGPTYKLEAGEHPAFIPGRTAWIVAGDQQIGVVGEIHPQVLENWKIHAPVGAFELRLEPLRALLG